MPKNRKKQPCMAWEEWYLLAARYYEEHGDLLIPRDYVCPTGQKLGRWIERQRAKYNRVPSMQGHIEGWQIEYLERIGMVWKLEYRREWEDWLKKLDWYLSVHGNIDVPHDYEHDGYGLGNWLIKQRLRHAAGELSPEKAADLEARGISWNLRTRLRSWDDWYADARAYYREHADLMVQLDYLTPDGDRLGFWIYRQRDIYMGRRKGLRLTEEQIDRLNHIGMNWEPLASRPDQWERMYEWVSAYRNTYSKLPLWPLDLKAPDGRSANGWIRTQRQQLADGRLSPERVERLAAIGIYPAKRKSAESGS